MTKTTQKKPSVDDTVIITCYNRTEQMTRRDAIAFYFDCMINTEGSERDRYTNIYEMLMLGYAECHD